MFRAMKLILRYQTTCLVTALFFFSCSEKDGKIKQSIKTAYATQDNLQVARNFAEKFQLDSFQYEGVGRLGQVPDSVVYAFKTLRQTDSLSHKRYLGVIFLKIYLDHLRCCHQSYELRNNYSFAPIDSITDPLLYEFNQAGLFLTIAKLWNLLVLELQKRL
jgi:hypothetical protein